MEREKDEDFESYKIRRRLQNKVDKQRLGGRPIHGFRTFRVEKDEDGNDVPTNIVESEFIDGKKRLVNKKVNYHLTYRKPVEVSGG